MARVSLRTGKLPILVVAPHGHPDDDLNTDIIADFISNELNCFHVINTGWRRAQKAVLGESIANLNDVNHCELGAAKREFLNPLISYKDIIVKRCNLCHVFYIHGMSNKIRHKTKEDVDIVLGYGKGDPQSYTCDLRYKNALISRLTDQGLLTWEGKAGGRFSAWKKDNLTQLFTQHHEDPKVSSTQLEIVNLRRYDIPEALMTAKKIAHAIDNFTNYKTHYKKDMFVKEF